MSDNTINTFKDLFAEYDLKQQDLVRDLAEQGITIARTSVSNLITNGRWPLKTNPKDIRKSLNRLLAGRVKNKELEPMFKTAPNRDETMVYGVISLIRKYNKVQADAVRRINESGVQMSPAGLSQILRHGSWPKNTDSELITTPINEWLSEFATADEISEAWKERVKPTFSTKTKKECRAEQTAHLKQQKPTFNDLLEPEMLNPKTMRHFGLTRHPFENEIRAEHDLYMSQQQVDVRESMVQASLGGSILAVIGEVGAGKTEIRKGYLEYIRRAHPEIMVIEPCVINKKKLTAEMIFDAIAEELQMTSVPKGLEQRARKVERALRQSVKAGNNHVLIIEEAHDLTNDVVKYLKRIWELSDGFQRLISIILVGQPELEHKLSPNNYEVREFSRRCNVVQLLPLGNSITDYVAHKFKRCNVNYLSVIDNDAISALQQRMQAKVSYGVAKSSARQDMSYPLIVNNLVVKAMNLACSLGEKVVTAEVVGELK